MAMNFKDAPAQTGGGDTVPPGLYKLRITLRPGGAGDDGVLKLAKNMATEMLDLKFDIVSGAYNGKRFFENWVTGSQSENVPDGIKTAMGITHARIRATLESAFGYAPDDQSAEAIKACTINSYADLNGLEIVARLGVRKQNDYPDRNVIQEVITPADPTWAGFMKEHPRLTGKGNIAPKPLRDAMDDEIPF